MKKALLLIGVLFVIFSQLVKLEESIQLYFFGVILLLTGVPHGSLDYFVEAETSKKSLQKISLPSFLFKYLLNMAIYAIVWIFFPILALILFIVFTAFHFGEIDWPIRKNTKFDSLLYTFYGLQIILFIITSHIKEAAPILQLATNNLVKNDTWILWGASGFYYSSIGLACSMPLLAVFKKQVGWDFPTVFQFISQTIILTAVINFLPLYLSFGFYFGIWHSLLSFNLIRKQMNLSQDFSGWTELIKKAIPFTVLAWIGLSAMIIFSITTHTQLFVITNLFIGISVLTLPHLQVFTKISLQ
jgi:Brp/Blh family beta-carotene 15,15'-monooxygenase